MEYDIFRDELAIKYPAHGHALWDPSHEGLDSVVQVGDVGFTRYGKFIRLFNVLLPQDHPSHQNFGVPEYHEPLGLRIPRHIYSSELSRNNFCSRGVNPDIDVLNAAGPGPAQVIFSCSRRQGAILSLPVPAHREETFARGDFARCITKRIDVWFAFARDLGLGVTRMEDIILVTGRDLSRSWTNVVFSENQGGEQVSLGVQVTGISNVQWEVEGIGGVVVKLGPSGQNLPEDQCIFVRGFRVRRRFMILHRLRGAAEPTGDPDRDEADFDKELISSTPSETDDPLHTLLDYLATHAPADCNIALVHDDDLRHIDVDSLDNLQPDAVLGNLQNSRPEILSTQWAFAEGGSEVEFSVAKVASFPPTSSESTSDSKSKSGTDTTSSHPYNQRYPVQAPVKSCDVYQPGRPRTWSLHKPTLTTSKGPIQLDSRSQSPPRITTSSPWSFALFFIRLCLTLIHVALRFILHLALRFTLRHPLHRTLNLWLAFTFSLMLGRTVVAYTAWLRLPLRLAFRSVISMLRVLVLVPLVVTLAFFRKLCLVLRLILIRSLFILWQIRNFDKLMETKIEAQRLRTSQNESGNETGRSGTQGKR